MNKLFKINYELDNATVDDILIKKDICVENNNVKKILCLRKLLSKRCPYINNCSYAHSLNEQKKDQYREIVYNMITSKDRFDDFDLLKNKEVYMTMLKLTKICNNCINDSCPGGYNCKFGVCRKKYQICYNDLTKGHCNDSLCNKIHLSSRGLVPYVEQKKTKLKEAEKENNKKHSDINSIWMHVPKSVYSSEKPFNFKKEAIEKQSKYPYDGVLLTDNYFKDLNNSTSEDSDEIRQTISYLNSEDSNNDLNNDLNNDSIFID